MRRYELLVLFPMFFLIGLPASAALLPVRGAPVAGIGPVAERVIGKLPRDLQFLAQLTPRDLQVLAPYLPPNLSPQDQMLQVIQTHAKNRLDQRLAAAKDDAETQAAFDEYVKTVSPYFNGR
jgi:hypothetical protein